MPWHDSLQAVAVVTEGWDAVAARLSTWERQGVEAPWQPSGVNCPVVIGRHGLGWGRGLHPFGWARPGDPVKREGDGRSPAGVFWLESAFGSAPADEVQARLPYHPCTPSLRWVDDPASPLYNRRAEEVPGRPVRWRSAERMLREDGLYRLGLVVGHNTDPVKPGAGSCIFLHVWRGAGQGTRGCTAMDLADLEALAKWLDPAGRPLLVQMPRLAFQEWGGANALPTPLR